MKNAYKITTVQVHQDVQRASVQQLRKRKSKKVSTHRIVSKRNEKHTRPQETNAMTRDFFSVYIYTFSSTHTRAPTTTRSRTYGFDRKVIFRYKHLLWVFFGCFISGYDQSCFGYWFLCTRIAILLHHCSVLPLCIS